MSHTLQRKMFKAPGSAAHGGGLTSGLELRTNYNKGGSVDRGIVGYQPKDHPARQGNREGHAGLLAAALPFLTMGASRFGPSLMRALSGKGIGSLKNMVLGGTKTAGSDIAGAGFGRGFNPVTGKIKDVVIKKGKLGKGKPGTKGYKPPTPDVKKTMNREQYIEFLRKKDPAKLKELFGDYGFGKFGRMSQIGRGAGASLLPTTAYGLGSSLIPEYDQKPETPIRNIADTVFREIPEGIGDLVTSLPTGALGLLAGQGGAGFQGLGQSLQNTLYPDGPKDIKQVAEGEEINQAKVKKAAEADLRAKYEELLGGKPSTGMMLAEAIADSAPYLAEDDLAGAAAQYTKSLGTGIKDRDTYDRGIGQMIIQKDISEDATNDAMIADALKTGDTATVSKIKKYQAAAEELGDVNALPTKGKNKIDYDSMQAGTVYADLTTATGNKYIAINSTGDDELRTNSASEAVNFANA
tara:strand:+ start:2201 stop:3601 length:1401 start_codon:yes stop_codon:yes gene_type:complete